jgi:hypothetical protein
MSHMHLPIYDLEGLQKRRGTRLATGPSLVISRPCNPFGASFPAHTGSDTQRLTLVDASLSGPGVDARLSTRPAAGALFRHSGFWTAPHLAATWVDLALMLADAALSGFDVSLRAGFCGSGSQ